MNERDRARGRTIARQSHYFAGSAPRPSPVEVFRNQFRPGGVHYPGETRLPGNSVAPSGRLESGRYSLSPGGGTAALTRQGDISFGGRGVQFDSRDQVRAARRLAYERARAAARVTPKPGEARAALADVRRFLRSRAALRIGLALARRGTPIGRIADAIIQAAMAFADQWSQSAAAGVPISDTSFPPSPAPGGGWTLRAQCSSGNAPNRVNCGSTNQPGNNQINSVNNCLAGQTSPGPTGGGTGYTLVSGDDMDITAHGYGHTQMWYNYRYTVTGGFYRYAHKRLYSRPSADRFKATVLRSRWPRDTPNVIQRSTPATPDVLTPRQPATEPGSGGGGSSPPGTKPYRHRDGFRRTGHRFQPGGDRERKLNIRNLGLASALLRLAEGASEAADFIDILYESLPQWMKIRWYQEHGRQPGYGEKIAFVAANWGSLNAAAAFEAYLRASLEDRFEGFLGRAGVTLNRATGSFTGGDRALGYGRGNSVFGESFVGAVLDSAYDRSALRSGEITPEDY